MRDQCPSIHTLHLASRRQTHECQLALAIAWVLPGTGDVFGIAGASFSKKLNNVQLQTERGSQPPRRRASFGKKLNQAASGGWDNLQVPRGVAIDKSGLGTR